MWQIGDTPILTSTRYVDYAMANPVNQNPDLGSLINEIAEKMGQSITAQLRSDRSAHGSNPEQPTEMTLSNVKLVMQSDVKEPPVFKGDGSDRLIVQEWENLMSLYLRKRAIPVHEQSQEIMNRLVGKAGDVVRIKLRN